MVSLIVLIQFQINELKVDQNLSLKNRKSLSCLCTPIQIKSYQL